MADASVTVSTLPKTNENHPELPGKQRRKKFTGGNASKRHRDRVNIEFNNLARLLPFPESVVAKLDKSSILRLAVSYIRAKSFFQDMSMLQSTVSESNDSPAEVNDHGHTKKNSFTFNSMGNFNEVFSQALDGFLLVLTEDMKVLYVTQSVREHLGYCQAGIIHENFLQFVNPTDENIVRKNLIYQPGEIESDVYAGSHREKQVLHSEGQSCSYFAQRKFSCRMKCAFSCSSRFYTAYRVFDFTGHLRKSFIQEGREMKLLNTLVVMATAAKTRSTIDVLAGGFEERHDVTSSLDDECDPVEKMHGGFRIEPTLRPHVAPIPVTSQEFPIRRTQTSCTNTSKRPPTLVSSEVYNRQAYYFAQNTKPLRQNISTDSFRQSMSSADSRFSDHSDDSKCSPVASPNLLWKQKQRDTSSIPDCHNERGNLDSRFSRENLSMDEGRERLHSKYFERHLRYDRYTPPYRKHQRHYKRNYDVYEGASDVYEGASMLMNLRYRECNSPTESRLYLNSSSMNASIMKSVRTDSLRTKSSSPGKSSFNISALLNLESLTSEQDSQAGIVREDSSNENFVDVCSENDVPFSDMVHTISKKLDATFRKTMSSV